MNAGTNAAVLNDGTATALDAPRQRRTVHHSVHDIMRDYESLGWNLSCHQIEPGMLTTLVVARKVARIRSRFMWPDRVLEFLGQPPEDHLALVIPAAGHEFWANGFSVGENDVLLVCPGATMHMVCRGAAFYEAHIPLSLLPELGQTERDPVFCRDGAVALRLTERAANSLRCRVIRLIDGEYDADDALVGSARGLIRRAFEQHTGTARSESWRTISRAREFVESNLHRPIRVKEVSDYAAASVSKLERAFRRELCITPSRYILSRRLHAVHCHLRSMAHGDLNISHLAMQHGFRHLGRFAATYRAQFGELPSETLQTQSP